MTHLVKPGVLTLSQMVEKMSLVPAQILGVPAGTLSVGAAADITVFDPRAVQDTATFDDPHCFPVGIPHVVVNGRLAIENGVQTDVLSGRVLRRQ